MHPLSTGFVTAAITKLHVEHAVAHTPKPVTRFLRRVRLIIRPSSCASARWGSTRQRLDVRWEAICCPALSAKSVEVVDVNQASRTCPVDLNHPHPLIQDGLRQLRQTLSAISRWSTPLR